MKLKQIGEAVENSKVTQFLRKALSSYFFPIVTAVVSVGCYYLGWDIVNIWYLCISGTAIMICCKDVSPALCLILFFSLLPSPQHSPSFKGHSSGYLLSPPILAQEIIGVVFFLGSVIYRLVNGLVKRKFKITPLFWGIVALCAAFCLSGVFYSHYTVMNLLYGLALSAIIIIFYVFCYCNFELEEKTFAKIASYFIAVAVAVTIELIVAYITYRSEGRANGWRNVLFFGWGTYNQAGLMLTMAIPAWFYLAGKHKKGYYFLLGAVANEAMCMISQSRQAMLMSAVVFAACCVWILIWDKGKKRIIDLIMMGVVLVLVAIFAGVFHKQLIAFVSGAVDKTSLATGSGRTRLWKEGWQNFLHKPLFGVGFYDPMATATYDETTGKILTSEVGFFTPGDLSHSIPRMCHNTVFQLLSSCGLVGLLVYVFHRVQTVISFINNVTAERTLIALTMCVLLLMSLLDNHLFYFITTIQYSILLALLAVTEKKKQIKVNKPEGAEAAESENKKGELNKEELAN